MTSAETDRDLPGARAGILIPAHNEAEFVDACLGAVIASDPVAGAVEIVVVANACTDDTAERARGHAPAAERRGWTLKVIECAIPGKLNALALGEAAQTAPITVYLDADVTVSPGLLRELIEVLDRPDAAYASGTPRVTAPASALSRAYGRFWSELPFVTTDVPGFGVFAVNRAGRQRWDAFPDIISDDTFVRLQFAPSERFKVDASYTWPLVKGLSNLVRVRRRQNQGVDEIARLFPDLRRNDTRHRPAPRQLAGRLLSDPAAFGAYALVNLLTRLPARPATPRWARGR